MKLRLLFLFLAFISCQQPQSKSNQEEVVNYDSLKIVLDSVHYYDQYFYNAGLRGKEKFTEEEQLIIKKIEQRHIQNLQIVTAILDKHGWLGKEEVGKIGTDALWLTIQHNDLATQVKYMPMLKEAAKNGKAFASDVAMLEDKMLLKQGKKQIYGSQVPPNPITGKSAVWPIENPQKVDVLREKVGLEPMSQYVQFWDLTWDVQQHIDMTKKIEAEGLIGFHKEKSKKSG